ncbi:acetate--CoA ligase family protein [Lampropedia puyangensis]|uniref:Acetate--CoA ligase family protein n=1 Tax=Lampropedia puyangensis TaxID=1330072 RepID=A0A4S8ESH6_9BURK|nr:acetate--CoA ligase family protein [Lampropedia puyangensis]THT96293.1 acetate--CoA ligase family protein [Lampropedia puyangensis]
MHTTAHLLDCLFKPQSIAVIGASSDPHKIGGRPLAYMRRSGFALPIYPINPKQNEVQGIKAFPSLAAIGAPVDQVIVAVSSAQVPTAIDEALAAKARSIIVFSSGFADVSEAGRQTQEALAQRCRDAGVPLVGPNCMGAFSAASGMYATFMTALEHELFAAGHVGIVSQSGAIGSYLYGLAGDRGLRFSHFVATGNESDIDVADCIEWMAQDTDTKVVMAYLEGSRNGERLRQALRVARQHRKPVIVMKVGRSEQGAAAAASHTGSLAGADTVYDAILTESGAWRANTLEEMVDLAYACSIAPLPKGNRLGMVTPSGGAGVISADAASQCGLVLPTLPQHLQEAIRAIVPFSSPINPVDTTAQTIADRSMFTRILEHVVAWDGCDMVLSFNANVGRSEAEFAKIRDAYFALRQAHPQRLIAMSMRARPEVVEQLQQHGILYFSDPARATMVLGAMAQLGRNLAQTPELAVSTPAASPLPAGVLDEAAARDLLQSQGIPFAPQIVATTADAAAAAADVLGYPVVMKVLSADIAHKSDVGGVVLNLTNAEQVHSAWHSMMERVSSRAPTARLEGALLSPMVSGGVETVMGVVRDPVFGPMVMFGLGGVFVEIFKDVVFRSAPVTLATAHDMIASIQGLPLLQGARGKPAMDLDTLAHALVKLSVFAAQHANALDGVEINPFIALPKGGYAVDALIHKSAQSQ